MSSATAAFWPDVLWPEYHGYSEGCTLVNGSFGVKWNSGAITTLLEVTYLFNQSIQEHIFGDIPAAHGGRRAANRVFNAGGG